MATAANDMPKRRKARYSAEYRAEALALAERIGVAAAASELGLHATQIYTEEVTILEKTAAYFAKKLD